MKPVSTTIQAIRPPIMSLPSNGTVFSLKGVTSDCYLGIEANADYAGARAMAAAATEHPAPKWFLQKEQDAHYLINASAPSMCLNVSYESKAVGNTLQQWSCNGGASELWVLSPASNDTFSLINKNSGLAAGAAHVAVGSSIIQMVSATHELSQWKIVYHDNQGNQNPIIKEPGRTTPLASDTNVYAPTLADEMMYNLYVPIYSQHGSLQAVTQDLWRIARMGFSSILIMPIHPIGIPTGKHPAVESPYAVADYFAVAPALGQLSDFENLVREAHTLGIKVVMDVILNHTAWNNPLVTQAPHYYIHTNRNKNDPETIAQAFWFEDVAQLDYKRGTHVQDYMIIMLRWWMENFNVDGFRFDTADNPCGKDRMIPASAWSAIGQDLKSINPRVILLGECTNPELSMRPFNMDYTNYSLQPAVSFAAKSQDARNLVKVLAHLKAAHPVGMLHTSIMQTWDMDLDLKMYGGPEGTMAAAVFNFTIEGVPMLFAGEEVANDRGGVNTHSAINWNGPLANRFETFYAHLGMLRRRSPALRRGSTTWVKVAGGILGVIAFIRTWEKEQCLIAVNFSASTVQGSLQGVTTGGWTAVTPSGALCPAAHPAPPSLSLGPWDFVVFAHDRHNGA